MSGFSDWSRRTRATGSRGSAARRALDLAVDEIAHLEEEVLAHEHEGQMFRARIRELKEWAFAPRRPSFIMRSEPIDLLPDRRGRS